MQQNNNGEGFSTKKSFKLAPRLSFSRDKDFDKYQLYHARLENMYKTPADPESALIHKAAASFGFNPPYEVGQSVPICPCCLLQVNTEELPLSTSTTPDIENGVLLQSLLITSGVSLFFTFIKVLIIYLFMVLLTVSLFALSMSVINTQFCELPSNICSQSAFIVYSPAKQGLSAHIRYLYITDYLNFIMVLLSILFFRFYGNLLRTIYYTLKHNHQSQDDFTLIVRNIPHMINSQDQYNIHFNYEEALKTLFEDKIMTFFSFEQSTIKYRASILQNFQEGVIDHNKIDPTKLDIVKSISLCFDLRDLEKITKFRDELVLQLPHYQEQSNQLRGSMDNPNNKLTVINEQYLELCRTFCMERNLTWTLTRFLGTAFVSFEFQHYKDYLLQLYESNPKEFTISNQQLSLAAAPKPEDINWFNLQVEKSQKIKSMLISYLVTFFIVLCSFFLVQSLKTSQFPVRGRTQSPFHQVLRQISFLEHLLTAALIALLNYLLRKVIYLLSFRQKHSTQTKHSKAMLVKYVVAQFANTTLIYYILSILQGQKYLQSDGVVLDTCVFGVVMGSIQTILHLFHIDQLLESLLFRLIKGGSKPEKEVQINYNKGQQLPEFDFQGRYSYYITLVYFCLFFSYINPINIPATLMLFFLNYWIDKYRLFSGSSMTRQLDLEFSMMALKTLEPSIFIFALGNFYYSLNIEGKAQTINILALVIAFTYILVVNAIPLKVQRIFCKPERNLEDNSYSSCIAGGKFKRTYWLSNPATIFTEQPDINRKGEIIDNHVSYRIARREDISRSRRGEPQPKRYSEESSK